MSPVCRKQATSRTDLRCQGGFRALGSGHWCSHVQSLAVVGHSLCPPSVAGFVRILFEPERRAPERVELLYVRAYPAKLDRLKQNRGAKSSRLTCPQPSIILKVQVPRRRDKGFDAGGTEAQSPTAQKDPKEQPERGNLAI